MKDINYFTRQRLDDEPVHSGYDMLLICDIK